MKNKLNYLVIGCGSIGKRHIKNLTNLNRNVIAVETDIKKIHELKKEFSQVVFFSSLIEATKKKQDVALICTPNHLHIETAIELAKKKYHLFIEKPLSHNLNRINELQDIVENNKLITLVGCNMRFQYGIKRIKSISKQLKEVFSIHCYFGQYLPDWRPTVDYRKTYSANKSMGGGVMLDAIHEIDYMFDIVKQNPICGSAIISNSGALDISVEDNVGIQIQFENKIIGSIQVDYLSPCYRRTCEIVCKEGVICWDEESKIIKTFKKEKNKWIVEKIPEDYNYNQSYIDELLHLEECINSKMDTNNTIVNANALLAFVLKLKEESNNGL